MTRVTLFGMSMALLGSGPRYFTLLFSRLATLAVILVARKRLSSLTANVLLFPGTIPRVIRTIGI